MREGYIAELAFLLLQSWRRILRFRALTSVLPQHPFPSFPQRRLPLGPDLSAPTLTLPDVLPSAWARPLCP